VCTPCRKKVVTCNPRPGRCGRWSRDIINLALRTRRRSQRRSSSSRWLESDVCLCK